MNIVNEQVEHSLFGQGKVISQEDGCLSIQFSEQYGIKQFLYPDAFEKYLKLCNHDVELSVQEELQEKQMKLQAEKLLKQQEDAERAKVLDESKRAVRKKKPVRKIKKEVKAEDSE